MGRLRDRGRHRRVRDRDKHLVKMKMGTQRDAGTHTRDARSLMDHSDGVPHLPAALHSPGHRQKETQTLGGSSQPSTDILQAMGMPRDKLDTGGFTAILTSPPLAGKRAENPQGISGQSPRSRRLGVGQSFPEAGFRVRKVR